MYSLRHGPTPGVIFRIEGSTSSGVFWGPCLSSIPDVLIRSSDRAPPQPFPELSGDNEDTGLQGFRRPGDRTHKGNRSFTLPGSWKGRRLVTPFSPEWVVRTPLSALQEEGRGE